MFDTHQWRVENYAQQSAKRTSDVIAMVLLSIRMQWSTVGMQMQNWREDSIQSQYLWGFKRKGMEYVKANQHRLFYRVRAARSGEIWIEDLMRDMLAVPGLGMVKAGFACQLLTGHVGCLDVHNIKRLKLDPSEWHVRSYKDVDKQLREVDSKIATYMQMIDVCGGGDLLWDEWCEHLASISEAFEDAEDVSLRHVTYLTGETS